MACREILHFPGGAAAAPSTFLKKTLYKQYGVTFHMKLACSMRMVGLRSPSSFWIEETTMKLKPRFPFSRRPECAVY